MATLPLPLPKLWGGLSPLYTTEAGGLQDVNPWKCGGPPKATDPKSFSWARSYSVSRNLSKLLFKCFNPFMAPAASALGKQILSVHLCLQILGWWVVLYSWILGRSKKIYLFSIFIVVRSRVIISKLSMCWNWNQKSSICMFEVMGKLNHIGLNDLNACITGNLRGVPVSMFDLIPWLSIHKNIDSFHFSVLSS